MLYSDVLTDWQQLPQEKDLKVFLITQTATETTSALGHAEHVLQVPDVPMDRLSKIKMAILKALSLGLLKKGDRLVCLSGMAHLSELDTLLVLEVGDEFELFGRGDVSLHLMEGIRPEVFHVVLGIAAELSYEGREGRPVGAFFVIGDHEAVLRRSKPLILNPFKGYSEQQRQILRPELKETVKELASLDGAFVIRGDGVIEAAGLMLLGSSEIQGLTPGLGTRHLAAAAITAATKALAITVSASTGTLTVFKEGQKVLQIERSAPYKA